uniref:Tensin 3, tandem duplicate 1 n=1 Tax=Sinocyclocheilus rhinocerous TaxID=307959 RepID=A0A673G2E8_9TELE
MAEGSEFDLDYITERIIGIAFHQSCTEQTYQHNLHSITQMLQSKHADRYMVINLSEHSDDLSRMNHRVVDLGWPERHAPSLHLLCSVCKNMDNWLRTYSENVLLLHCKVRFKDICSLFSGSKSITCLWDSDCWNATVG